MNNSLGFDWDDRWTVLSTLPRRILQKILRGQPRSLKSRVISVTPESLLDELTAHEPFRCAVWLHCTRENAVVQTRIETIRGHRDLMIASVPIVAVCPVQLDVDSLKVDFTRSGVVRVVHDGDLNDSPSLLPLTAALMRHRGGLHGFVPMLLHIQDRLAYQNAMKECTRIFIEAQDSTDALRDILAQLRKATHSSCVYVFENYCDVEKGLCARQCFLDIEPSADSLQYSHTTRDIQYNLVPPFLVARLSAGESIARALSESDSSIECPFLGRRSIGSCLFIPLFVGKVFWGFIGFERPMPSVEWTDVDKESISTILSIYVATLERMLLDRLASVQRHLAIDLSAATDVSTALKLSLKAAMHAVGFESGGIYIVDYDARELILKYSEGISAEFIARVSNYSFETVEGQIVLSGQTRYVRIDDIDRMGLETMRREGLSSVVNIPIRYLGEVIACLNLASKTFSHVPDFLRKGLEAVAYQIGVAFARITIEEKLRRSEEQLRSIMTHSQDLILLCDREGRYRFVSSAARTILGCEPDQLIGKPIRFVHPDDENKTKNRFEAAFDNPKGISLEYRIIRDNGDIRWVSQSWAPIVSEDSETMLVGIIRDITDAREAYEQLHQSLKMEAIGRLAGGVAHEFNNMLTGILGYASLLRSKPNLDTSVMHAVCTIEKAAEQAAQLTRQLLGFARKGKYQTVPVDLHSSIQEVLALLRWTISKDIRVVERLKAQNPIIMGDPTQLQQVLLNLTVNACESMPAGGTLVISTIHAIVEASHARTAEGLKPGNYILLTVSDTGSGIEPQHLPHIFEPFFTTKEKMSGTGMGLAMVYGIVKNHSGFIYVDSKIGHGSTFSLFFPRQIEYSENPVKDDSGEIVVQSGTIMLVDDDQLIRETAESLLQTIGFNTILFPDGYSALEFFRNHHTNIDMVILDMIMPQLTGLECYRLLRKIDPDVKVLMSTGYSIEGRAAELREEGICGFIQKPYTLKQLSKILYDCKACEGRNPRDDREPPSR